MKDSEIVLLGVGAIAGLWLLSELKKPAAAIAAATNAVEGGIADVYESLTFAAPVQVTGSVDDQSGNVLGPISSFPAAHDSQGNTYLQISGAYYQLGPRDSQGNFTAIPVNYQPGGAPPSSSG